MKKWLLVLLSALLLVMPMLSACSQARLNEAKQHYDPNYTIGIIKTTESERSSYIEFYNEELELVNAIWYPYGGLWTNSYSPSAQKDGLLYLIPRGLMGQHNDRKIISLNLTTGDVREYTVNQVAITSIAVDGNYIYTSNNHNFVGQVGRVDIETGKVKYFEFGSGVGSLFIQGSKLHASWIDLNETGIDSMGDDVEFISRLDQDLNPAYTVSLTDNSMGSLACISEAAQGEFYMTLTHKISDDSNVWLDNLYVCSSLDKGLRLLGECAHVTRSLLPYQDKLITVNSDENEGNNFIDIYNRHNGVLLLSLPIDYVPRRAVIDGDALYVQGFDCLVKYSIDGLTVTEIKRIGIPRIGSPTDADFHYLSGIFLNK